MSDEAKALLIELDGVARDTGHYEYGLPLFSDGPSARMGELVDAALAEARAKAGGADVSARLLAACKEMLAVVDEAYTATGYFKVAETSEQRLRLEAAFAAAEKEIA